MVMDLSPARQRSRPALPLLGTNICSGPGTSIPAAGHFLWQSEAWGGQLSLVNCSCGAEMGVFPLWAGLPKGTTPHPGLPWLVGVGWHEPSESSSAGRSALAASVLL